MLLAGFRAKSLLNFSKRDFVSFLPFNLVQRAGFRTKWLLNFSVRELLSFSPYKIFAACRVPGEFITEFFSERFGIIFAV